MSVHVEINIAEGAARRHLFIYRIDPTSQGVNRSLDDIANYAVEVEGGRGRDYSQRATFWHRYGDSELILVGEAVFALLGHLPSRPAPEVSEAVLA
jgi:hypothetical protein